MAVAMPKITEQQKLIEIAAFVRHQGLSLRIRQQPARKERANGWYLSGRIQIYTQDRNAQASVISALILHEYGHCVATRTLGVNHTEATAWDIAARAVPARWRPSAFRQVRRESLASYREVGIK